MGIPCCTIRHKFLPIELQQYARAALLTMGGNVQHMWPLNSHDFAEGQHLPANRHVHAELAPRYNHRIGCERVSESDGPNIDPT